MDSGKMFPGTGKFCDSGRSVWSGSDWNLDTCRDYCADRYKNESDDTKEDACRGQWGEGGCKFWESGCLGDYCGAWNDKMW